MPDANYAAIAVDNNYGLADCENYASGAVTVATWNGTSPQDVSIVSLAVLR
jgi:hypothetical protein